MFTGHKFGARWEETQAQEGPRGAGWSPGLGPRDGRSAACHAASLGSRCRPTHLLGVMPSSLTRLWGSTSRSLPAGDPHLPHAGPAPTGLGVCRGYPSAQHSGWYQEQFDTLLTNGGGWGAWEWDKSGFQPGSAPLGLSALG